MSSYLRQTVDAKENSQKGQTVVLSSCSTVFGEQLSGIQRLLTSACVTKLHVYQTLASQKFLQVWLAYFILLESGIQN